MPRAEPAEDRLAAEAPLYDWTGFGFDNRQVHSGDYPGQSRGARVPPSP
jgi:hypothetical protein